MWDEVFQAVESGAVVLTAGGRLARVLARDYSAWQRGRGRALWTTPDILTLPAYLDRLWRNWMVRRRSPAEPAPALLTSAQERAVWERIIAESPEGESLLRIPETAARAMEAWKLMGEYRLHLDGEFEASEDCAAFRGWAGAFQRRLESAGWMEASRLGDFAAGLLARGLAPKPARIFIAGFEQVTPQEADLFRALGGPEPFPRRLFDAPPQCFCLRDASDEIQAAALWARRLLENNPDARVGVIVPDLASARLKVTRTFRDVLHPGAYAENAELSFHLSAAPALNEYPMVHAALQMLQLTMVPPALPQIGALLRSPFLGGSETELDARAALDARLRRRGVWGVPLTELREAAVYCPLLQRALGNVAIEATTAPREQSPGEWAHSFSQRLKAFGWPGERVLSSAEFQTLEAWNGALSAFARLDAVRERMTAFEALDGLRRLCRDTPFQTADEGAPIQIIGLLEASGLRFDHLWVMGLHDEALPAPARPNPFLPLALQRAHNLPHSSAARELEFGGALLRAILGSAPDVIATYPRQEGDRALEPTPLLPAPAWRDWDPSELPSQTWAARMRGSAPLETLVDETGPPLPQSSGLPAEQPGGTGLFRDIAACSFRAFAQYRMGARALEDPGPGIDARSKGKLMHRALELIWSELQSQRRLLELSPGELRGLLARHIAAALDEQGPALGRNLEQIRLEELFSDWMEIEKTRRPFVARPPEQERIVAVGGIQVRMRVDRIDELEDGRQIILDYKTGEVKTGGWAGERPEEPQLPLYCATNLEPMAGAAFVQIRTGEMGFRGVDESASLPGLKAMRIDPGLPFARQVEEWRRILDALGDRYRAGAAEANPKPGACEYCGLTALCRIRELENA